MADQSEQTDSNSQSEDVKGETQEQAPSEEPYFPDLKLGKAWGESITQRRAADLEQRLQAWQSETDHGQRSGPFELVGLPDVERKRLRQLTGADVFWIAARTLASTSDRRRIAARAQQLHLGLEMDDEEYEDYLDYEVEEPLGTSLASLNLSRANLHDANLAGAWLHEANLSGAYLYEANLSGARLRDANLSNAALRGANLSEAVLEAANLAGASLDDADVTGADLTGVNLAGVFLKGANLSGAHLLAAKLTGAYMVDAKLSGASLGDTNLAGASLDRADLAGAHLRGANLAGSGLGGANLAGTYLFGANLMGTNLSGTNLSSADLRGARMNVETNLTEAIISPTTRLADVIWNSAPLARITWETLSTVGDEVVAHQHRNAIGKRKDATTRLAEYEEVVRAYRLLAVALRSQGLNEHADRYAYRAQLMQRTAQRYRRRPLSYIGSLLLDVLAGYGYRPGRAILLYLAVIVWFANFYSWASTGLLTLGLSPSHIGQLPWYEALVLSVSSFHGRGFLPFPNLGDPITIIAAGEAVFGLVIEVSFIATFTQRFFSK